MTKKTKARSKRGTKDKPVDAEIRRAAERSGIGRAELVDQFLATLRQAKRDPETEAWLLRQEAKRFERAAAQLDPPPGMASAPAPRPPWLITGAAFDGDEVREDATAADLFALCFAFGGERGLLDDALVCAADDAKILAAAMASGWEMDGVLERFITRSEYRVRAAREAHRRIEAAAQESGGAS
jgi:hypothetical protein